jgi:hypothetical protein
MRGLPPVAAVALLVGLGIGLAGRRLDDPPILLVGGLLAVMAGVLTVGWLTNSDGG